MPLDRAKKFPKRPRLKSFNYKGQFGYFITILTHERRSYFTNHKVVNNILDTLKNTAFDKNFLVYGCCFMPDHLHLVVVGNQDNSSLTKFISLFKQKSSYEFRKKYQNNLWHRSFYDHVLRKSEDLKTTTYYVLNNPVRKGLVKNFLEYPYCGSIVFDIGNYA